MNPIAILRQFFRPRGHPLLIGAGITLGFLIGLMPGHPHGPALIVLLMATRVNIPMALLTVFAVSPVNWVTDKITTP